jgi:hypothetical protein
MIEPLPYLSRVVHLLSAILLVGGIFYAWGLSKANSLPANPGSGFRPGVSVLVGLLFLAGAYNLMLRLSVPLPKAYHMLFGVKFLLFLHVASVAILMVRGSTTEQRRARMLQGLAISGGAIVLISVALRFLSQG